MVSEEGALSLALAALCVSLLACSNELPVYCEEMNLYNTRFVYRHKPVSELARRDISAAAQSPSTTPRGATAGGPGRSAGAPLARPARPRRSSCLDAANRAGRCRSWATADWVSYSMPASFILASARWQRCCARPERAGSRGRPRTLRSWSAGCCAACATLRLRVPQ